MSKNYKLTKCKLTNKWKPKILVRDHYRCRVCHTSYKLELAHITDAYDFQKLCPRCGGVTRSFRYDNLIILCNDCHKAYHWVNRKCNSRVNKYTYDRARKVYKLFNELKKQRGYDVVPSELVVNQ